MKDVRISMVGESSTAGCSFRNKKTRHGQVEVSVNAIVHKYARQIPHLALMVKAKRVFLVLKHNPLDLLSLWSLIWHLRTGECRLSLFLRLCWARRPALLHWADAPLKIMSI